MLPTAQVNITEAPQSSRRNRDSPLSSLSTLDSSWIKETEPVFQDLQPWEALPGSPPVPFQPLSLSRMALCTHPFLFCPREGRKPMTTLLGAALYLQNREAVARLLCAPLAGLNCALSPSSSYLRSFQTSRKVERIIRQ